MESAKRKYYLYPHQFEFSADIITVEKVTDQFKVELSDTWFFPQGGGQPADRGWINEIAVEDVREINGRIFHFLKSDPGQGTIHGRIDPHWRHDYQQQHSGQHIVSAVMNKIAGRQTVSVHFGEAYATIETDCDTISPSEIEQIEKSANRIVCDNIPFTCEITHSDLVHHYPLRRPCLVEGEIRLVMIRDFDCAVCCGLHVDKTGDVGLIKIIDTEKIRNHVRLILKIGQRAYEDYQLKNSLISQLRCRLSCQDGELIDRIDHIYQEMDELKSMHGFCQDRLVDSRCDHLINTSISIENSVIRLIVARMNNEDAALVKKMAKKLLEFPDVVFCLLNQMAGTVNWLIGHAENLSLSFLEIRNQLLPLIQGRGGGSPPFYQGIGNDPSKIESFLEGFSTWVKEHFSETASL
jgi:alanyl-tRNA synthetase